MLPIYFFGTGYLRIVIACIVGRCDVSVGSLPAHALARRNGNGLGQAGTRHRHVAFHLQNFRPLEAYRLLRFRDAGIVHRLDQNTLRLSCRSPSRDSSLISHTIPGRPPPRAWSDCFRMLWASGAAKATGYAATSEVISIMCSCFPYNIPIGLPLDMPKRINNVFLCRTPCRHVCCHRPHHPRQDSGYRAPRIQVNQQRHRAGTIGRR